MEKLLDSNSKGNLKKEKNYTIPDLITLQVERSTNFTTPS